MVGLKMNISETEYLKAKAVVAEYERHQPLEFIAVICPTLEDFSWWKREWERVYNYKPYKLGCRRSFKDGAFEYVCIRNVCDARGFRFCSIIEGPGAREIDGFDFLMKTVKMQLKIE